MNDWLSVGQFSKKTGLTVKALHLYEEIGLLKPKERGDNGYRYYGEKQVADGVRIKEFKDLGFSLNEIQTLLQLEGDFDLSKMVSAIEVRLALVQKQEELLRNQKDQIQSILASLKGKSMPLKAQDRRAVMSFYGNISIVVTGCEDLLQTAKFIQAHFSNTGQTIPILEWTGELPDDVKKPYVLVLREVDLDAPNVKEIHPDVIVVRNVGVYSECLAERYLALYEAIGPHVNTVLNADDRGSVKLAKNPILQKGRIFYYSKNGNLASQIEKIGGVISNSEVIDVYGLNLKTDSMQLKFQKVVSVREELALMSSIAAVLTVGFEMTQLKCV